MDWKLEVVIVPVSDMDRAKAFYSEQAGFHVDVDYSQGEDFRIVQFTPPGSAAGGQQPGLDPERAKYGSYFSFSDPDGNGWLVQEVRP
jgi:predicted enzyme related to lactoylglutathione lyase